MVLQFLGPLVSSSQALDFFSNKIGPYLWDTVSKLMDDPTIITNSISRMGDTIVWEGAQGKQVIAAIATLGENQDRISTAITGLESANVAMKSTLGTVQTLSMATLGLTSLSAGMMMWRIQALDKRLKAMDKKIGKVINMIDAQNISILNGALAFYQKYENNNKKGDLDRAYEKSNQSATNYGTLLSGECADEKRLPVLNYFGRCYLLALLTELKCMAHHGEHEGAIQRIKHEQPLLKTIVETTYHQTLGKAPDLYLNPNLYEDGVTLELMTDLYQQLEHAEVFKDEEFIDENGEIKKGVKFRDACALFERLRGDIYLQKSKSWNPFGKKKKIQECLKNLRYMISCVEDCNRVRSLGLLIQKATEKDLSMQDLNSQLSKMQRKQSSDSKEEGYSGLFAYGFA